MVHLFSNDQRYTVITMYEQLHPAEVRHLIMVQCGTEEWKDGTVVRALTWYLRDVGLIPCFARSP